MQETTETKQIIRQSMTITGKGSIISHLQTKHDKAEHDHLHERAQLYLIMS